MVLNCSNFASNTGQQFLFHRTRIISYKEQDINTPPEERIKQGLQREEKGIIHITHASRSLCIPIHVPTEKKYS